MLKKIFKFITTVIFGILILFALLVIFSLAPIPGNFKLFTVQSGSMEPSIGTGSLIFIKSSDEYNVGDVVTMKTEEKDITITHRIVEKEIIEGKIFFKTKGDANNTPDSEKTSPEMILGKVFWDIPLVGYPVGYAKTTQGIILIVVIPAVIIVYDEILKIKKEVAELMAKRKLKKEAENEIN